MLSDNRDLSSPNGYLLALFVFGALTVAYAPITSAEQISYRLTITPAVPTDIDLLNAVVSTSVPVHVFYDEARVAGSAIQVFITTRPETVAPNARSSARGAIRMRFETSNRSSSFRRPHSMCRRSRLSRCPCWRYHF
jgi:hypothetical protein